VLSLMQAELYQGNPVRAHEIMRENATLLQRSLNLRISFLRIETNYLLACLHAAHTGVSSGKQRQQALKATAAQARSLRAERLEHAAHLADAIDATIAVARGEMELATELLERAALGFSTRRLTMHAAACRYQLAERLGGEQHRARANAWFDANGVVRPNQLCNTLVPLPE
jgi:hypothetical protein